MPKNGNITGEVFDDGVIKQIDKRQEFLGARYKTDEHLIFQNNQNSFLRLASSINIGYSENTLSEATKALLNSKENEGKSETEEKIDVIKSAGVNQLKSRGLNENLTGMELAKACVLFGGTVGVGDKLNPNTKFGIVDNVNGETDFINTIAAYGWGGISKGFKPFPGIESAKVGFYNRGALQKADVKIKVNSLEQLQIFDLLYFRIGYTMLLEWGHNTWIDNEGNLQERNEFVTEPFQKFFTEGTSQQDIIKAIKSQRTKDSYNYDAMVGKVTNFNWKFNEDGSYDIVLKLVGLGDIIESLKVNRSVVSTEKVELTPSEALEKKSQGITAGENAADAANEAAQQAQADAEKELNEWIEEYAQIWKNTKRQATYPYQPSYNQDIRILETANKSKRQASDLFNSGISLARQQDTETAAIYDRYIEFMSKYLVSESPLNAQSNPRQVRADLQRVSEIINQIRNKGIARDKDLQANDDFGILMYSAAAVIDELVEALDYSKDNLFKNLADAKVAAESQSKESENIKKRLAQARQRVEKEKEIQSLSPLTSVENKNKTLFNLKLYDWRQQARSGKDPNNLYKLKFTANSANPDSTGVSTLSLDFYYVRLGYVLEWIQHNLLIYDSTKKDPNAPSGENSDSSAPNPMFKIDYNPESNFCLRFPAQFSADPRVCLIPSKYSKGNVSWDVLSDLYPYFVAGDDYKGKLMNIFVNIDHTASVLDKNMDANGKVNLLKFLTNLLKDVNDCLGNVNRMEPVFDTEENLLKIIDANGMDDVKSSIVDETNKEEREKNPMAVFQVYGIGNIAEPIGSFVTDVDFKVELPPNMAAMATISAQAGGNVVGENATGLSKLNYGIEDRLISVKLDKSSIEGAKTGNEDPEALFSKTIQSAQKEVNQLYGSKKFYSKDTVDSLRSNNRDIALYLTGNEALEEKMPSPFFIPFNLKLDMQGLSGMRNYERFSITEAVLPYSYRSGDQGGVIDFLIKGISHNISRNSWTTSIETLTVSSIRKWKTKNQGKK